MESYKIKLQNIKDSICLGVMGWVVDPDTHIDSRDDIRE